MSVGAVYASIGLVERPTRMRLVIASMFVLGAVLTRVTAGWATGLLVIAVGIAGAVSAGNTEKRRWALPTVLAGLLPLTVGVVINWAKFRQAVLIPFDDQVWTDLSWRRQRVLRDGGVTGFRFLPSTLYNYLRPWGLRLSPVLPFVTVPAEPAQPIGSVFLEMPYPTPSVTATMPLLVVLAGCGTFLVFRRGATRGFAAMRLPMLGAIAVVGGVLMVGYITPRYLAEFVPFLAVASVVGVQGIARARLDDRRTAIAIGSVVAVLGVFGAVANLAIATTAARVGNGGRELFELVAAQNWISERTGNPMKSLVSTGSDTPAASEPGEIRILGDCDAMYFGTGDPFEPWVAFDGRDLHVHIAFGEAGYAKGPERIPLVEFDGSSGAVISVEFDEGGDYRLVLDGGSVRQAGPHRVPKPGTSVDLWIVGEQEHGRYLIASPGELYATLPSSRLRGDVVEPTTVRRTAASSLVAPERGLIVTFNPEPSSGLCRDLLDEHERRAVSGTARGALSTNERP
jgi:hypothetical protein